MKKSHGTPHAADRGTWHHGANTVGADGVRGRRETGRRSHGGQAGSGYNGDADWLDREVDAADVLPKIDYPVRTSEKQPRP